jgi:hypothetical protein
MRRKGLLSVITSKGDKEGALADVLKRGALSDEEVFSKVGGVDQVRSDDALLAPRGGADARRRDSRSLLAEGPARVESGERTAERRAAEIDLDERGFTTREGDPPEGLMGQVRAQIRRIRDCWERALHANPLSGGRMDLDIAVAASGEVSQVRFARDTVDDGGLRLCIESRVHGWHLPPSARAYRFTLPLIFLTR